MLLQRVVAADAQGIEEIAAEVGGGRHQHPRQQQFSPSILDDIVNDDTDGLRGHKDHERAGNGKENLGGSEPRMTTQPRQHSQNRFHGTFDSPRCVAEAAVSRPTL